MENLILKAENGLKTKFNSEKVKFKKTFLKAKKLGIDLNNTNEMFKGSLADGSKCVFKISFVNYIFKGRYTENIDVIPFVKL